MQLFFQNRVLTIAWRLKGKKVVFKKTITFEIWKQTHNNEKANL